MDQDNAANIKNIGCISNENSAEMNKVPENDKSVLEVMQFFKHHLHIDL